MCYYRITGYMYLKTAKYAWKISKYAVKVQNGQWELLQIDQLTVNTVPAFFEIYCISA